MMGPDLHRAARKVLAANLKAAMAAQKLTIRRLAVRCGVSDRVMVLWVSGRLLPNDRFFRELARALKTTPEALQAEPVPVARVRKPVSEKVLRRQKIAELRRDGAVDLRRKAEQFRLNDEPEKALNALVLADLVAAHFPQKYPNFTIAGSDLLPTRFRVAGTLSYGSPGAVCADMGGV